MADNQRVQLPSYSMFAQTPIYRIADPNVGNVVVFGLLQDIIVPDPTDTIYQVPIGALYRLDLIATSFYGVPDLWWVIARVNDILDPLAGPGLNQVLRIPTKSRLAAEGVLSV